MYLQRVSSTFRRFVLDNLSKIEANSIADELVAARDKVFANFKGFIPEKHLETTHSALLPTYAE